MFLWNFRQWHEEYCHFQAVHHYHSQITSVTAQVLDQYRQLFGAAFAPGRPPLDPALREQRKARLLGELNSSGTYFAFKEQMKVIDLLQL